MLQRPGKFGRGPGVRKRKSIAGSRFPKALFCRLRNSGDRGNTQPRREPPAAVPDEDAEIGAPATGRAPAGKLLSRVTPHNSGAPDLVSADGDPRPGRDGRDNKTGGITKGARPIFGLALSALAPRAGLEPATKRLTAA